MKEKTYRDGNKNVKGDTPYKKTVVETEHLNLRSSGSSLHITQDTRKLESLIEEENIII